jgi:hypothetical protein
MNLTKFEKAVMDKLLHGEHFLLEKLRIQLAQCYVSKREFTGVGFWTDFKVNSKLAYGNVNFHLGDVHANVVGVQHGIGFVLFIEHGLLSNLEGYTYDEPYPENITQYTLYYETGDERKVTALFDKLSI